MHRPTGLAPVYQRFSWSGEPKLERVVQSWPQIHNRGEEPRLLLGSDSKG